MSKWLEFKSLSWDERVIFIQACVLLPLMALALRLFGWQACQRVCFFKILEPMRGNVDAISDRIERVSRMVNSAAYRGCYRATCLPRSLVIGWLLGRRGITAELRLGVRHDSEGFKAHAWVETEAIIAGRVDPSADSFALFDSLARRS